MSKWSEATPFKEGSIIECNDSIVVTHPNGYAGRLYGEQSLCIYKDGNTVLHTGFRSYDTPEELYKHLERMPELMEALAAFIEDDDEED